MQLSTNMSGASGGGLMRVSTSLNDLLPGTKFRIVANNPRNETHLRGTIEIAAPLDVRRTISMPQPSHSDGVRLRQTRIWHDTRRLCFEFPLGQRQSLTLSTA